MRTRRVFCILPPERMRTFTKPALSVADQLVLLERRGLVIGDWSGAEAVLRRVGYYRLSAYAIPFRDPGAQVEHQFRPGTHFRDIVSLYDFDRRLRLLVTSAVERIEVAFRAHITNVMSSSHGAHWFMEATCLSQPKNHPELLKRIADEIRHDVSKAAGRSVAVRHYYDSYTSPSYPPGWVVIEELTFGTVSRLYDGLAKRHRNEIARNFAGQGERVVSSWIRAVGYTRNLCAHHSRLWNRSFTFRPMAAKVVHAALKWNGPDAELDTFYAQAVALRFLLLQLRDVEHFQSHLPALLNERLDLQQRMGFPEGWKELALWV